MSVPAEVEALARITPTRVVFEYDPRLSPAGSDAEYAAELLARAVGYVNVDVAGLVQRYLADVARDLPADVASQVSLRAVSLVESVRMAMQANLRRRLGLDLATTLLPRLERTPGQ